MRVIEYKEVFQGHVVWDPSILHMNEGLWHSWSFQDVASTLISPLSLSLQGW